jgi:exodeoxyribonuclease VII small subunit
MTDTGAKDTPKSRKKRSSDAVPESAPSLEDRLKRLEEIVRSLEASDLDMDAALGLFEEGVEHVRGAEATLRVAELKVEELLGPEEDSVLRPLEEDPE